MTVQKFKAVLQKFDSKLWHYHIRIPNKISTYIIDEKIKRLVCTVADKLSFQCAMMPAGEGDYFINVNKSIRTKLRWNEGGRQLISLEADTSDYGLIMNEELEEILRTDAVGHSLFHTLTPGKQRNLIYLASSPKRTETRLKKSIIIIDYLKSMVGVLDFKELNQAFRDRKNDF